MGSKWSSVDIVVLSFRILSLAVLSVTIPYLIAIALWGYDSISTSWGDAYTTVSILFLIAMFIPLMWALYLVLTVSRAEREDKKRILRAG